MFWLWSWDETVLCCLSLQALLMKEIEAQLSLYFITLSHGSAVFHFQPQTFYAPSGKLVPIIRLRPQPEATCHLRKLLVHMYWNSGWPRGMSSAWEDWLRLWTEWLFVLCTVLGKRACWSNIPDRAEQLAAGAGCYLASGCRHTWDMKVWWSSCRSGLSGWFNWCGRSH